MSTQKTLLVIAALFLLFLPNKSQAVPSPDLVVGIGTTIIQWISIGLVFVLSVFGAMYRFLRMMFIRSKIRFFTFVIGIPLVLIVLVVSLAVYYQKHQERGLVAQLQWPDVSRYSSDDSLSEKENVSDNGGAQKKSNLVVSNDELQGLLTARRIGEVNVLDAREDIEYNNGRFPGSIHIRIADLHAGKWSDLDKGKTVIVLCWSGIRGKEVAEFLRSQGIDARYLEDGAQDWVENGGLWDGGISIKKAYSDPQYSRLLNCDEVQEAIHKGVFVVDSREPDRYSQFHIPESVNIPMLYTPSSELENAFAQVPHGASVIAMCDGYVNCFDARVTGIELEKRGYTFLGRFTDPKCFR